MAAGRAAALRGKGRRGHAAAWHGEGRQVRGCEPASHGWRLAGEEDAQAKVEGYASIRRPHKYDKVAAA
jgi:hypothetical protein